MAALLLNNLCILFSRFVVQNNYSTAQAIPGVEVQGSINEREASVLYNWKRLVEIQEFQYTFQKLFYCYLITEGAQLQRSEFDDIINTIIMLDEMGHRCL